MSVLALEEVTRGGHNVMAGLGAGRVALSRQFWQSTHLRHASGSGVACLVEV